MIVGDDEAGRVGGKDADAADIADAVALDPAAAAAQAQADAAGALDGAVGDRQLADIGKVDQAAIAFERPVGAVEDETRERDARGPVGGDQRSVAFERQPRRAGHADEPRPVGKTQGRGAQRAGAQDRGAAGAGGGLDGAAKRGGRLGARAELLATAAWDRQEACAGEANRAAHHPASIDGHRPTPMRRLTF